MNKNSKSNKSSKSCKSNKSSKSCKSRTVNGNATLKDILEFIRESGKNVTIDQIAVLAAGRINAGSSGNNGSVSYHGVDVTVSGPGVGSSTCGGSCDDGRASSGCGGSCGEGGGSNRTGGSRCGSSGSKPAAYAGFRKADGPTLGSSECRVAMASRYFGQVLVNGEVFCPYTSRRWLPAQYLHLMDHYGPNVDAAIARSYNSADVWRTFEYELNTLEHIRTAWKTAFDERSAIFPLHVCTQVVREYLVAIRNDLNDKNKCHYNERKKDYYRRIPGYGTEILWHVSESATISSGRKTELTVTEESSWLKSTNARISSALEALSRAKTHGDVAAIVHAMPGFYMGTYRGHDGETRYWQPATWRKAFKKAGAYYTLKSLVADGHIRYSDNEGTADTVAEGLIRMRSLLSSDVDAYVVHAILKKSMEVSGFNIKKFLRSIAK